MKKVLSLLLCLLLLSGLLFAAEGRIGVTLAPQWLWYTETEADRGETNFLFMAEGANYFGKEGGFGVEYGLGVNFPVNEWLGDHVSDSSASSAFVFKAGLGYKYAFNDSFGIVAGLGIDGNFRKRTLVEELSISYNEFSLNMYGKVAAQFTLIDFLGLDVGVMLGGPVYITRSLNGQDSSFNLDSLLKNEPNKGFYLAPFVGVSFVY